MPGSVGLGLEGYALIADARQVLLFRWLRFRPFMSPVSIAWAFI